MEVDLLIKNVHIFNAYFKKFVFGDAAIINGRFFHIGKAGQDSITSKEYLDGKGQYLIPGLIDIHMHIESSMTTPFHFSQAAVTHGVTTVVADPHEIANVFGIDGIKEFINNARDVELDIFYGIPSSVPSTSSLLETTGGFIGEKEAENLLDMDRVLCLGEVMNFKDLTENENSLINRILRIIKDRKPDMPIEGHCPKIDGINLSKYIYNGVDGDHTQQTAASLEEKIGNGMFIEIQAKSMSPENMKYLMDNELYEHFCFVTDDTMADKLVEGQLNKLVEKAISLGLKPELAIYAATYTPARRMGLRDRGSIAPGKLADFVLLEDIQNFKVSKVYKRGKLIFNGNRTFTESSMAFPSYFYNSIKLKELSSDDFHIFVPDFSEEAKCRTIEVSPHTTFTEEGSMVIRIRDGELCWQDEDCCLIGVFERYGKSGNRAFGLVRGSIIKEGAVAASWAHDHHNLMVMGRNIEDMTAAANYIIENQGGYCAVNKGNILGAVKLPVGGIISEERLDILAENLKKVRIALKALGYEHHNEIMSFSTLSLPVSPSLKITDKGLIRVSTQEIVPLIYR